MKNKLVALITIVPLVLSPCLRADSSKDDPYPEEESTSTWSTEPQYVEPLAEDPLPENVDAPVSAEEPSPRGTPVGQGANEGVQAAKRKQLQNIAIAAAAVVVATTALILIASNDGHHSHKD